jgi:hypothetical protein
MSDSGAIGRAPFEGPAAWKGSTLQSAASWTHHLSSEEIAEIVMAVAHVNRSGIRRDQLDADAFPLPRLGPVIADWARELVEGRGFVLVRGLPVTRLPEEDATLAYLGIGHHLGVPLKQNLDGDLVGQVRATGDDPNDVTVRRYKTTLEQPFHTDSSEVVGLLCLTPALSGGKSSIASSVSVFNSVLERRPDLVDLLFEPFSFDLYEQQAEGTDPYFVAPLCRDDDGRLSTYYIRFAIEQAQRHADVPRLTDRQIEVLDLVDTLAAGDELRLDMDFEPGDMQFLKNSVILHSRTSYVDDEDPTRRRHLLRLWIALHRR